LGGCGCNQQTAKLYNNVPITVAFEKNLQPFLKIVQVQLVVLLFGSINQSTLFARKLYVTKQNSTVGANISLG
jgi:hypothetical protein